MRLKSSRVYKKLGLAAFLLAGQDLEVLTRKNEGKVELCILQGSKVSRVASHGLITPYCPEVLQIGETSVFGETSV